MRPVAAVMDTSFSDSGHFNAGKVRGLARIFASRHVELWIPQQVVLEWAVHAQDVTSNLRQARRRAFKAELVEAELVSSATPPPRLEAAVIAEELQKRCADMPNVTVLAMSGEAAIAGIRDQILGTPPGTVRKGVRTGAVDSSWVRDALLQAQNNPQNLVFLTANGKDVRAAIVSLGHSDDSIRTCDEGKYPGLFDELFPEPEPAEEPAIDPAAALFLIASSLRRDMADSAKADDGHGPPPAWITVDDVEIGELDSPYDTDAIDHLIDPYTEVDGAVLLVDVLDVDVGVVDARTIVTYTVRLLADVRVEGQVIDNDGTTLHDRRLLHDRLLVVPYSAEIREGALHDVEQIHRARSFPAHQGFSDGEDAYRWLYDVELTHWESITVVPSEPDPDWDSHVDTGDLPSPFELRGPRGRVISAALDAPEGLIGGEWTLDLHEAGVEITAFYDPAAHVRADDVSFDAYPPFDLWSVRLGPGSGRPSAEPYTALAAVWNYLMSD
jgi:hypothetical protein